MLAQIGKACGLVTVRESVEQIAWGLVVKWFQKAEAGDIDHVAEKLRTAFPGPMQRWMVAGALRAVARRVEGVQE